MTLQPQGLKAEHVNLILFHVNLKKFEGIAVKSMPETHQLP